MLTTSAEKQKIRRVLKFRERSTNRVVSNLRSGVYPHSKWANSAHETVADAVSARGRTMGHYGPERGGRVFGQDGL